MPLLFCNNTNCIFLHTWTYNCSYCWAYNIFEIIQLPANFLQKILPCSNLCLNSPCTCTTSHLQLSPRSVQRPLSINSALSIFAALILCTKENKHSVYRRSIYPCTGYIFMFQPHSFSSDSSSRIFLKTPNSLGSHRSDCSYQFLFITSAIDQLTTD